MRQRVRQMPLNAITFRAPMPSAARSAQTPPVEIDGVIEVLEPGGFLEVPDVAPHGPVTRIVILPTLRACAHRNREPLGWAVVTASPASRSFGPHKRSRQHGRFRDDRAWVDVEFASKAKSRMSSVARTSPTGAVGSTAGMPVERVHAA